MFFAWYGNRQFGCFEKFHKSAFKKVWVRLFAQKRSARGGTLLSTICHTQRSCLGRTEREMGAASRFEPTNPRRETGSPVLRRARLGHPGLN